MMHVELRTDEGVVGEIVLEKGRAVGTNAVARSLMDEQVIVEPGDPPVRVKPEDGERYLRALPVNVAGSYFWAVLKD